MNEQFKDLISHLVKANISLSENYLFGVFQPANLKYAHEYLS